MSSKHYEALKRLFTAAEARFSLLDWELIEQGLAERTLCGALMNRLNEIICFDGQAYNLRQGTVADVEYNRFWNPKTGEHEQKLLPNQDCRTCKMTDKHCEECQKRIFTDIIVHKRKSACNEIAIEAKKIETGNNKTDDINNDRKRLINLTSQDGEYKYKMGILCIFHPWDKERKRFRITHEFYKGGEFWEEVVITYWADGREPLVQNSKNSQINVAGIHVSWVTAKSYELPKLSNQVCRLIDWLSFSNMIYVGDGLRDVPYMKLVKVNRG